MFSSKTNILSTHQIKCGVLELQEITELCTAAIRLRLLTMPEINMIDITNTSPSSSE